MSTFTIHQCHKKHNEFVKKAFKSKDLSLKLTTTINEEPIDDAIPAYDSATISGNGTFVWVVRTYIPPRPPNAADANLYRNEGGLLALVGSVPPDPAFDGVSAGAIAESGTFAYVIDEAANASQIRVFSVPSLALLRTIPLPNVSNPNFTVVGFPGVFLNRYAVVSYPTDNGQNYVAALVDLISGNVVTAPIGGLSPVGGYVFELNGRIYTAIGSAINDETGPSILKIFVLQNNQLIRVEEVVLPSFMLGISVQIRHCTALIAVSTTTANVPGTVPITGDTPPYSNPTGEPSGIRIFAFDGCELCLVALKTMNSGQRGYTSLSFDSTGRFLVATAVPPTVPTLSTLITYRLDAGHNCELDRINSVKVCCKQLVLQEVDVNFVAPLTVSVQFSANGRWLIISGGDFGVPNAPDLPEVNLFRVFYAKCAKFEDAPLLA